jgi:threonine dehydrogenase-like Zn-dependent dehydrogenase
MKNIPNKSRAAVIVNYNKPFEIREFQIPEVVPGAILVKIEMAGICGTDVHQQRGEIGVKPRLPVIPGHEAIGRIIKMGDGRTRDCTGTVLSIGDRIMWTHISCGECSYCTDFNQPNLCENRISYGMSCAEDYPYLTGAFSEYVYILPKADVVRVPEELSNEEVIGVCCAFRTAVSAFERLSGIGNQRSIVIQGSGPVGLYSTLLAVEGGASTTIVVGAPALRLKLAKKFGANHIINIDEQDFNKRKRQILELTNGKGPDIVVEASGAPIAFREGMEMVRRGGRFLIIGQSSSEAEQSIIPGLIMIKHLEIIGNCSATIRHYYRAIQFIKNKRGKYPFGDMVTNKYSLDQINLAIEAMAAGKEIKPVIIP